MSEEDAPTVKMGLGQVVQVEVSGTTEDTTEDIRELALETVDELREEYHDLQEEERNRRASGDDPTRPLG